MTGVISLQAVGRSMFSPFSNTSDKADATFEELLDF